jgi:RNA polymerase sigma-70 factor (sigma-E family)
VRVNPDVAPRAVSAVWGGRVVAYVPAADRTASTWTADEAVTELFPIHYRGLVRLGYLLLRDNGMAEEIAQDAFVALHAHWTRLREPEKGVAYLRQSVVNRARSALRHRGVVDRFLHRQAPPATAPSAEAGALDLVAHAEVLEAVRALPTRQREALVLRYYADLSEAEIAEAMGVSQGAVKSHTSRGLAALRRTMEHSP